MSTPYATFAAAVAAGTITRDSWDVMWNSDYVGLQEEVNPDIKWEMSPITIGALGPKQAIGYRFDGVSGFVKCQLKQFDPVTVPLLTPWNASGDGGIFQTSSGASYSVTPPLNADLYQYAKKLVLHPHSRSTTDLDLIAPKACPISEPKLKRGATVKDDIWEVMFALMIDRTALASNPLNPIIMYIGQ